MINAWLQVILAAILFSDINELFAFSCLLETDLFGEIIKLHWINLYLYFMIVTKEDNDPIVVSVFDKPLSPYII